MFRSIERQREFVATLPDHDLIWTPEHPHFWDVLHGTLPPVGDANITDFAVRAETGVLEPMDANQLQQYFLSGEWEVVEEQKTERMEATETEGF